MEDISYLMKHSLFQREGHSLITSRTTEVHQETTGGQIKGMQTLHTSGSLPSTLPLNLCYKTPHQIPPGWDTQFWGHEPAVSFFAWQGNKAILFYFTQNSTSEIQFNTSAQRPNFQHHYYHLACIATRQPSAGDEVTAARLDEHVPSCSFLLRLSKFSRKQLHAYSNLRAHGKSLWSCATNRSGLFLPIPIAQNAIEEWKPLPIVFVIYI